MDVRARIVLIISAVGSYACMRRPTSCLAGTSDPTSFSGNLGSNFLPRPTSFLAGTPGQLPSRITSPIVSAASVGQDWRSCPDSLIGCSCCNVCARDVILERVLSRGMFRERLQVGPSRARLFLMTMLVIPSRLYSMTARSSYRQLHFTGVTYGYGELISCLGSRIRQGRSSDSCL